jgi:putative intracellular protease/amidase
LKLIDKSTMLFRQLLATVVLVPTASAERVLSIVTNVGEWYPITGPTAGNGIPKQDGYWLTEFTHSYDAFAMEGWDIDVASPLGGRGPADPSGFVFYANDPVTQKYVVTDDNGVSSVPLTENTLALEDIDVSDYDAVFFVGGTSAMFDFPRPDVHDFVRRVWEADKILATVCHGAVALADVVLSNGKYLVEDKLVTGFANDEEENLGRSGACTFCYLGMDPTCDPATCDGPYMPTEYVTARDPVTYAPKEGGEASYRVEDRLKLRGAKYVSTFQDWDTFYFRPHVVTDGRLVTGQNPGAGKETAEATIAAFRRSVEHPAALEATLESNSCTPHAQTATDAPAVCFPSGILPEHGCSSDLDCGDGKACTCSHSARRLLFGGVHNALCVCV